MKRQGYRKVTLGLVDKSPEVSRLLVKLHDRHKLYELSRKPEEHARVELASIMADLLDVELSVGEKETITDVLMSLMYQAEIDLRQAVAERLSVMENAPLRLVLHFANDTISVADSILRRSRVLNDMDLVYIVKAQDEEHWRAIAERTELSGELVDALAETKDLKTAICLSQNNKAELTEYALGVFSVMAQGEENLAEPLLMREDFPDILAIKLYNFVGNELKGYIKKNYSSVDSALFDMAVDDIILELSSARLGEYTPTVEMIVSAEEILKKGDLKSSLMLDNLRRGQIANFIAMFSVYCGLQIETVAEMLSQKTAQGLAVACKATGIEKADFVNMFLLTSRVRGGKVIQQSDLGKALAYYDKVSFEMAKRILSKGRH